MGYEKSADGHQVVSATYPSFQDDEAFEGILIAAAAGATTIVDHPIVTEVHAVGGFFWSNGGNLGDYIDISVVDKDDVLGLFSTYGLTVGVDVLELGKWVKNFYINPNGTPWAALVAHDAAPVIPGLYLRAKYENIGALAADVSILYELFHQDGA